MIYVKSRWMLNSLAPMTIAGGFSSNGDGKFLTDRLGVRLSHIDIWHTIFWGERTSAGRRCQYQVQRELCVDVGSKRAGTTL